MVLGVKELNVHPRYRQCPRGPYGFQDGNVNNNCDLFHFWSLHSAGRISCWPMGPSIS